MQALKKQPLLAKIVKMLIIKGIEWEDEKNCIHVSAVLKSFGLEERHPFVNWGQQNFFRGDNYKNE